MISIRFLFNKGIYKNTLRRFKWGSFIYFIMLFFSVPFVYMMDKPGELQRNYVLAAVPYKNLLFSYGNFVFPMLMAIAVPTVVALLLYNYVHSSKHGIFVHTIPATRTANYISSIAAGFTLMLLPIFANAVILCVMMFFGYSKLFSLSSIAYWAALNIFIIFIMFSVATFSSFLTGNSFAQVAINAIIHAFLPIIAVTMALISEAFLYGYSNSYGSFAKTMFEYTPIVWIVSTVTNDNEVLNLFTKPTAWVYVLVAFVFYALAILLYKKRRIENCGEVAAFKVMKPILKYTVTAFGAAAAFAILINLSIHWSVVAAVSALVCAIVYFACEMILNKTLKVFHAYRGYLGFAAACAVVICFCAFTSVFGFETYIPDVSEIETATMYTYYNETIPVSSEEASKEVVTEFHREFISDIPVLTDANTRNSARRFESHRNINLEYTLKNGKSVTRSYLVSDKACNRAISAMFAFADYKRSIAGIDSLNMENISNMQLNINLCDFDYSFALNEDAKELLRAIEKDMKTITYDEYNHSSLINYGLSLSLSPEENDKQKAFKEHKDNQRYYYHFDFNVNSSFKNAIEYLKNKGYIDLAMNRMAENMYITKTPVEINYDKNAFSNQNYEDAVSSKSIADTYINVNTYVNIEKADSLELLNYVTTNEAEFEGEEKIGQNYLIFVSNGSREFYSSAKFVSFLPSELPEYLKKYVE